MGNVLANKKNNNLGLLNRSELIFYQPAEGMRKSAYVSKGNEDLKLFFKELSGSKLVRQIRY